MHLFCTDLDLERLSGRSDQRCMQRLVHIRLRHSNIILETSRNRRIHLMDHTQRRITVFYRFYYDTHSKQIIDLVNRLILIHHLLIDTEEMFDTSVDLCFDIRILHMCRYFFYDLLYEFFPLCLSCIDLVHQVIEHLRLGIFERQVIKLCLDLGNTKTLCDRRIDVHRLFRFFFLLCRRHELQGTHIMQTVCQFDNDHTDILRHGKEHLTQVFCLYLQFIR